VAVIRFSGVRQQDSFEHLTEQSPLGRSAPRHPRDTFGEARNYPRKKAETGREPSLKQGCSRTEPPLGAVFTETDGNGGKPRRHKPGLTRPARLAAADLRAESGEHALECAAAVRAMEAVRSTRGTTTGLGAIAGAHWDTSHLMEVVGGFASRKPGVPPAASRAFPSQSWWRNARICLIPSWNTRSSRAWPCSIVCGRASEFASSRVGTARNRELHDEQQGMALRHFASGTYARQS